jgi:hypothetical protein
MMDNAGIKVRETPSSSFPEEGIALVRRF